MSNDPMFKIHKDTEISLEILRDGEAVMVKDHVNNKEIEIPKDDFKNMIAFFRMYERVSK